MFGLFDWLLKAKGFVGDHRRLLFELFLGLCILFLSVDALRLENNFLKCQDALTGHFNLQNQVKADEANKTIEKVKEATKEKNIKTVIKVERLDNDTADLLKYLYDNF